jgi:SAM-dependent methyltransferase
MSASTYTLDSQNECERLERQATIGGAERQLRHLPGLAKARILDAGSGSGAIARLIASRQRDWSVVGVDFNPNYVRYAEDRRRAESLANLTFEQGDVRRLHFAEASFDLVWSRFVLYFLPDPEAAITEFKRLVRPGGIVILSLHNWTSLINFPEDEILRGRQDRAFGAIAGMSLAPKVPSMLSAAGFGDISVEIELDPIYTAIGNVGADSRRNYADGALRRHPWRRTGGGLVCSRSLGLSGSPGHLHLQPSVDDKRRGADRIANGAGMGSLTGSSPEYSRAVSRQCRAGADGRFSDAGPRSSLSIARSSRRCARRRTAR